MDILVAIVIGVGVLLAGSLPWGVFAGLNFRVGTQLPWAIVPMSLYLWGYWRFIGGAWGWPETAAERRTRLRANGMSAVAWGAALGAGLIGFAGLLAMLALTAHLVRLPESTPIPMPAAMPAVTGFVLLAMQSIVAGVTEESAFRGYMQSMIERRYGLLIAILVNGVMFGLLHFPNHPNDVLLMLPYYLAVSAVYGGLTWAANSILPALVLHSLADIVILIRWRVTGRSEWQILSNTPSLVWESGADRSFVLTVILVVIFAAAIVLAYRAVRRLRGREEAQGVVTS